jgi:hypothetical protein
MDRSLAQPQALRHRPLRKPLIQPQPQHLADFTHRQSLAWHLGPLLLDKEPTLPMVERLSAAGQHTALPDAIMITGTDDHDPTETMITVHWID